MTSKLRLVRVANEPKSSRGKSSANWRATSLANRASTAVVAGAAAALLPRRRRRLPIGSALAGWEEKTRQ